MKSLKVLMSAYACEPEKGSEPGVGWNVALQMAKYHHIWVITRTNNREGIEANLLLNPQPNLHCIYFDLPKWVLFLKRGVRSLQLYYYLWQIGIYFLARKLHKEVKFDLVHHVTFVRYWSPSFLSLLPIPFLWGPVGGAESTPKNFLRGFGKWGMLYEAVRAAARRLAEFDPFMRFTVRKSSLCLTPTRETAERLKGLGSLNVHIISEAGLKESELPFFNSLNNAPGTPLRFLSLGRLLHWKGFHLSLQAFAQTKLPGIEYWIIGDGPDLKRLKSLTDSLNLSNNVSFLGRLSRGDALKKLGQCHVLIHPSLHDSGGWVCLEAMATGKPVICLELGGPAMQVQKDTGFKIPAYTSEQVVRDMAHAMVHLTKDQAMREQMGNAGRRLIAREYTWERKGERLNLYYKEIIRR